MAVPGSIDVSGRVVGRAVAVPLLDNAEPVVDHRSWPDCRHHRCEDAQVDHLAVAALHLTMAQGHEHGGGGGYAADAVGEPERGQRGWTVGLTGEVGEAAHRLG